MWDEMFIRRLAETRKGQSLALWLPHLTPPRREVNSGAHISRRRCKEATKSGTNQPAALCRRERFL